MVFYGVKIEIFLILWLFEVLFICFLFFLIFPLQN